MIEHSDATARPALGDAAACEMSRAGTSDVEVVFSIEARPDITSIALVGDFNDWSPTAHPMRRERRRNQRFMTRVWLRPGRRYRYQLLVDGIRWENDWAADDYEENVVGADVSVIDLTR